MTSIGDRESALAAALARLPRVDLAHLPTPLDEAPRLGSRLGVPVLFKRDDATGLALGGNKVRMFEFVLGAALAEGYDTVLGGAALPANYCRQLAGACSKLGLRCVMVFGRRPPDRRERDHDDTMLFLAQLFGVEAHVIEGDWSAVGAVLDDVEAELLAAGRKVLRLQSAHPDRGSLWTDRFGLHAVGYCSMLLELLAQLAERRSTVEELWLCSSEATQAGLVLANEYLGRPLRIRGVSPAGTRADGGWSVEIAEIANDASAILDLGIAVEPSAVESIVAFEAEEEGQVTAQALEAVRLVARLEGLALDPVYTGKAMAAMIDHLEAPGDERRPGGVVFLHTGGTPAVFSYQDELAQPFGA